MTKKKPRASKKKKPRASKKKKPRTRKKSPARITPLPGTPVAVLTKIIIKPDGSVDKPEKLISFRKGPLVWLIHNKHLAADHTVTVDPNSFMPSKPLVEMTPLTTTVKPRQWDVLIGNIKPDAYVQTGYTYGIHAMNLANFQTVTIDPDLDVVDPKP